MAKEYIYQRSIDCALHHITVARENFAHHYGDQFDCDWAMDQFNRAVDILEQLKEYEPPEWEENNDG